MDRDRGIQIITSKSIPLWRDERVLKAVAQVVSAIAVIGFLVFFFRNVLLAAEARGLGLGYDFLGDAGGIPLAESPIPYDESQSFGYAYLVGILNTMKAAVVGIVLATLLGTVTALARISGNWLVSKIATVYIEIVRNVPLLVQLFIWYFAVFQRLPDVKEAIGLPGPIYLSQRGLYMPAPVPTKAFAIWAILGGVGIILAIVLYRILLHYQVSTGRSTHPFPVAAAVLALFVVGGWLGVWQPSLAPTRPQAGFGVCGGEMYQAGQLLSTPTQAGLGIGGVGWFEVGQPPLTWDLPVFERFNFAGGWQLTTEYAALVTGLVFYTGAYIAEVVRAGLLAVQHGQYEAGRALGLSQMQLLRLVVMPQALRVIIPPLISQYLNLTKNSSLAVAVGYPDLFYIGRTVSNQAGRVVPIFVLIMATYLSMSLITSLIMNIYNRRVQLVER